MEQKAFVLFYAWQSDSPSRTNRNFIENAAKKALKSVAREFKFEEAPRLDKDTMDVPGIPDIANTILEKIQSSSAFLADVTIIGNSFNSSDSDGHDQKPIPNPNVMLEFGYALASLGPNRIIHIMNTAYGSASDLPFDLKNRRWPITYHLPEDCDESIKASERDKLTKALVNAIKQIAESPRPTRENPIEQRLNAIETVLSAVSSNTNEVQSLLENLATGTPENQNTTKPESQVIKMRESLIERLASSSFEGFGYKPSSEGEGAFVLVIRTEMQPENPLSFDEVTNLHVKLSPLGASGWDHRRYGDRFVTIGKLRDGTIISASEIRDDATIFAAGRRLASITGNPYGHSSEATHYLPTVSFERELIEGLQSYLNVLKELGIEGPFGIALGLVNMQGSILAVKRQFYFDGRIFTGDSILPPPITIGDEISDLQSIARSMRPIFDYIWREYNYPRSLNYDQNGNWVGQ